MRYFALILMCSIAVADSDLPGMTSSGLYFVKFNGEGLNTIRALTVLR